MIYSIENANCKIEVNSKGAELYSYYSKVTNTEYLWQGDGKYWSGRAYNLFPFIGRMVDGYFTYAGKKYESRAHGLARYFEFSLDSQTENSLTLLFTDNEETRKEYPFSFEFRVTFLLEGSKLTTRYEVKNTDSRELLCAFGGHPGINIPFTKGAFEDYYLEFAKPLSVKRQLLAEGDRFMADEAIDYPLVDGNKLPLRHDLFEHDAVILENSGGIVSVKSKTDSRYVTMDYSDYKFIGFWHIKGEAPYVCLEPWSALPAIDGVLVELESKPHMTKVPANGNAVMRFTMEIHE